MKVVQNCRSDRRPSTRQAIEESTTCLHQRIVDDCMAEVKAQTEVSIHIVVAYHPSRQLANACAIDN